MALDHERERYDAARRKLEQRWREVRAQWNDLVAWHFERTFWQDLQQRAHETQHQMDNLAHTIESARRSVK